MRFKASLEVLPQMLKFVSAHLEKIGCTSKQHHQIELTMEEVLVNVINYAYPNTQGELEIECISQTPQVVDIIVKDWGIAFDPQSRALTPKKDIPLEERKIGGLGIYFVYQLMDKVEYERKEGTNILHLTKYLV